MSRTNFAPITSSLLARKGEGRPAMFMPARGPEAWAEQEVQAVPPKPELPLAEHMAAESPAAPSLSAPNTQSEATLIPLKRRGSRPTPPKRPRKLAVKVSQSDYERLGLAAVKKDVTRSDIVRQAIDSFLQLLSREYRNECRCISPSEACCRGDS